LRGHNLVELPLVVLVVVTVPQEEVFTSVLTESCRDSSLRGHSIRKYWKVFLALALE
jgi:hypothetical protein